MGKIFEFIKDMLSGRSAQSSKRFNGTYIAVTTTTCANVLMFIVDQGTMLAIMGLLFATALTLFGLTTIEKKKGKVDESTT